MAWFLRFQRKYALLIVLLGFGMSVLAFPRAVQLLKTIKTDLIHLLPEDYASVKYSSEIKKKFNRKSSLSVILKSPEPEANFQAMLATQKYLENNPKVDYVEVKKRGFNFVDDNKMLLIELKDLYGLRDSIKDEIQKRKLGSLYLDFEEGDETSTFEMLNQKFKDDFAEGVNSVYKTNPDRTVYVLNVYPKKNDSSLKFFKQFGNEIDDYLKKFDFKKYHPQLTYGYAGAIKTRVDQYDALIYDLKQAGVISGVAIFMLLFFFFARDMRKRPGLMGWLLFVPDRMVPVVSIFIPMIFSTLIAFWFNSFFFDALNVVTSFLFAIIFGLGVDIGIHLISRYLQDKAAGVEIEQIHKDVVLRTGKSCAIGILTTVASFYVLTINDFRGFSEFGWIAANGLVIALACYLIFFPSILILIDRYNLLPLKDLQTKFDLESEKHSWIPKAKWVLAGLALLTALALVDFQNLKFEWDFNKLKMKIAERVEQKALLKETVGRENSPAVYLVKNDIEARRLRKIITDRMEEDSTTPTIQFFRSFYGMVPFDQAERFAVLKDIQNLLNDEALKLAKGDEKKKIEKLKKVIQKTKPVDFNDLPPDIHELFWGNTGITDTSVAYVMPLSHLHLNHGKSATDFFDDVYEIKTLGKTFYALSDAIVFAQVLKTLFKDAERAIFLALIVIFGLISFHFRNVKRVAMIFASLSVGIIWMLGAMALFDVSLNFYNMIIIPAMIGMGVDNSVHVIHRFDEIKQKSIIHVLKTSGGAAFLASLTTIFGYSGMCFTRHPGLQSIGWMAIVGMGTCLLASLVLLPLLLQVFRKDK